MSALFPRWTNTFSRLSLAFVLALPVAVIAFLMIYVRSPLGTGQWQPVAQPVQFDHRHHVTDDGIDCRYCHSTVERSPHAGVPSTAVCMGCHSQIWNRSPLLEVVRDAYFSGTPILWNRVHRLPEFTYFNHAIHVNKGVGCVTCHGRVDQMPEVMQAAPLTMSWCLECHRAPERYLRPLELVTSMTWQPPSEDVGAAVAAALDVRTRTECNTCHR